MFKKKNDDLLELISELAGLVTILSERVIKLESVVYGLTNVRKTDMIILHPNAIKEAAEKIAKERNLS